MIYDKLSNRHLYYSLGEGIRRGLDFLSEAPLDLPAGRVELEVDDYANVQDYTTCEVNASGYEAHRKYVDIQYLLSGRELVKVRPLEQLCESCPYDEEKDYALYTDDGGRSVECPLGDGYFVILFPDDAHMPTLRFESCEPVRKVVVKVER